MRHQLKIVFIVFVLFFNFTYLLKAQDTQNAKIETVKITPSLYMLTGPGGNIAVSVGNEGVLIIDSELTPLSQKVKSAITALSTKPIRFLINTHWHFDHVGGNETFGQAGAIIVAQDNVRKKMSTEQFVQFLNKKIPPSPKIALPMITFPQEVNFHFNEDELHVFHVAPAHTDGDSVIYFKQANVLHTGDIYFAGMYPFIDNASGGSLDGMIADVDQLLTLVNPNTKIIPGHGPLSNMNELKDYRAMLAQVRDQMKKLIAQGQSLEQIIAAKPNAQFDEKWGKGFLKPDDFIRLIYADLTKKN